jgi:hypothetical protein
MCTNLEEVMKTATVGAVRPAPEVSLQNFKRVSRRRPKIGILAGIVRFFTALVGVVALLVTSAHAQDVASITGTVTDKTDAPISDATVKLTDTRTGAVYESKTGSFGAYLFVRVPPGPGYVLTVTKENFKTYTVSNLYLAIASTRTQDVVLELGTVAQTVEVQSEGSVSLNTSDSTIGNNFDMRAVDSLPTEFRDDPAALLRLEPGVVSAQSPNGNLGTDPSGSRDGSVAGARADQNNITVDGIDATDFAVGQAFSTQAAIPVDAVQEFSTQVGNPVPMYGRGSGAQTIITTKSGTNEWHGQASEYNRTAATEANDFFNNADGVPRTSLVRNQFGADLGGPIRKDKLFFFFDYEGRRDNEQQTTENLVPLNHVKEGEIAYINATNTQTGQPCSPTSRLGPNDTSTPCVTILPAAQVAALDPCSAAGNPCASTPGFTAAGFDPALLSLFNTRYPAANDLSAGDGLNTGGFRFNIPNDLTEDVYTTRVDYNINSKNKMFVRFNFNNQNAVNTSNGCTSEQFPGDPLTCPIIEQNRAWVLGETWTPNSRFINQFTYGETRVNLNFPVDFNGNGNDFPLNWFSNDLTIPYTRQTTSSRIDPVPTFRDDVTLIRSKHSFQFGAEWKPIKTRSTLGNSFNFISEGLGGNVPSLTPALRPANILSNPAVDPDGIAISDWDNFFAGALGVLNEDQTQFIYSKSGVAQPLGAVERRDYRYYQYAGYAQDTWRVRSDLTLTLGVRYQYDSVPYEVNGIEATFSNTNLDDILATRTANGLAGISGPDVTPQLTYALAGKANPGGAPLYGSEKTDFSPRFALAWNPSFRNGFFGDLLGDHKTVFRLGAAQIYDQTVINAVNFIEDQASYLFGNDVASLFGTGGPAEALTTEPRYTGPTTVPFSFTAPPFQNPLTPTAIFNFGIDPQLKTPYSNVFSAGVQRQLHGGLQLEVDYYGRFGHRLFTLADAAQAVNFVDPASKQSLAQAGTILEQQARQGVAPGAVGPQPFFENQMNQALAAVVGPGATCETVLGSTCTQYFYANNELSLIQGNLGGAIYSLDSEGLLPPNVGYPTQFAVNALGSSKGWSSYNAMLLTLRKQLSRNLQFDFNYTFSHSEDNSSIIANNNGNFVAGATTVMCDATNLSVCRGNSEFDVRHQISSNFIYDLPIGRRQWLLNAAPRWVDEVVGGWQVSGIVTWRTGLALPIQSGVSTLSLAADDGALFTGSQTAVASSIHTDVANNNAIQFFANPTAAAAAFTPLSGLEVGNRDTLSGPHFSNVDLGVAKVFPLFREKYSLRFRVDAFNVFNHPNFALPNTNINSPDFGVITSTAGQDPFRVLQASLRFQF